MWGVSKKLELYLRTKKVAREKAEHSSGGSNSSSGWGVWGGAKSNKAGGGGNGYVDERRREEADRIRSHLDRVARPAQWQGVSVAHFCGGGGRGGRGEHCCDDVLFLKKRH